MQYVWPILSMPQDYVACIAKQPSHFSGCMVVVNVQRLPLATGICTSAHSTPSALRFQNQIPVRRGDAVARPERVRPSTFWQTLYRRSLLARCAIPFPSTLGTLRSWRAHVWSIDPWSHRPNSIKNGTCMVTTRDILMYDSMTES